MRAGLRLLAFPCALLVAASPSAGRQADPPSDAQLFAAWKKLSAEVRFEVVEWFSAEVQYVGTFQRELLEYVLRDPERDPFGWPELERAPVFDPKVHAPAQPIARKWLDADSSTAKRAREKIFASVPERRLESAWVYDHVSGEPRRVAALDDPERLFRNAVAGFPPWLDLAEALVERTLDDGSEREALAGFAHAYTDRSGNVYPGVTLYDAWASGTSIEMPDVDTLGIIHEVLDDWKSWKAPVTSQGPLYDKLTEIYVPARRHRGLRLALARTYLTGSAVLRDSYEGNLVRFHALWEKYASEPGKLAEALPESDAWADWLGAWVKEVDASPELLEAGRVRLATLDRDARTVRALLVRVMRELGALGGH